MRKPVEQFQDRIARLFPEESHLPSTCLTCGDGRRLVRTVTFQVTDACNLRCKYCYQINKCTHSMPFEVAKKFFDLIIEADEESNDYINPLLANGLIIEFIGGEPFLEIDLIDKITDYCIDRMIELKHPWANKFMISICSNGVLYFDERVQRYIDGNKELHDACRVFPDGSGSYDIAIAGVKHFREHYDGHMGSKMTLAPNNIEYMYNALVGIIETGYKEIHLNCVFEEGWDNELSSKIYYELKKVADYLIEDRERFDNIYMSIFDEFIFHPKSITSNENWCGGTGAMISCDWKGDIYPCIRYMESSLGDQREPIIIGNVNDGIMPDAKSKECVRCMRAITRRSQSEDKCFYCPIADGCAWCSAHNYQCFGTIDKRATFICPTHIARTLVNAYLWNKANRLYYPDRRFKIYVPKEWALDIIPEEEWNMLKDLEAYTDEDAKYAAEFYSNPDNKPMPDTEIHVEDGRCAPHFTNLATYEEEDVNDAIQKVCDFKEGKDVSYLKYWEPFQNLLMLDYIKEKEKERANDISNGNE